MLKLSQAEIDIINHPSFSVIEEKVVYYAKKPSILDLSEKEMGLIEQLVFSNNVKIEVVVNNEQEKSPKVVSLVIEKQVSIEEPLHEVAPVIQTHVYPVWKDLMDNLRANNGIAEIEGKITHVSVVGIIGDDLVIIPTKAIRIKKKFNWKAELKALKLDDKIVLESDKFIAKLDVVTDAPDIEEMIRKYNASVESGKQFTGFINV